MNIRIVSSFPTFGEGVSKYVEFFISCLKNHKVKINTTKIFFLKNKLSTLKWIILLFDNFDIVHIQYTPTGSGPLILLFLLFHSKTKKCIITSHETPSTYSKHLPAFFKKLYLLFEKYVHSQADSIVVHTEQHHSELINLGISAEKIHILPHPVFRPEKIFWNQERQLQKGIFFGKIGKKKGLEILLQAMKLLPETITLDIIGTADKNEKQYEAMLKYKVEDLGISSRVKFIGFLDDAAVSERMMKAGFAVFPYSYVTQSGSLNTAIGSGLVYIASDLPAFKEFNRKFGGGILFKSGCPENLAEAIIALMKNKTYLNCLEDLKKACDILSWENYTESLVEIYESTR